MADTSPQRRLAAILAADVVGYSRLMGEDEQGTRDRFNADLAEHVAPLVERNHGRIVKTMGDGLLVEFASVVEAVHCAVAIQKGMTSRNADRPASRRIEFRIGLHLGDVIVEGDDIHGDGVNIAARLEGLAGAGNICISGRVEEFIRDKIDVEPRDLGSRELKNIAAPVRVFEIATAPRGADWPAGATRASGSWRRPAIVAALLLGAVAAAGALWLQPWQSRVTPASAGRMVFPLPDKPSIAVLPFANLSGDPDQEYFVDGMTDDLITDLSKISGLFVIARNSVFTFKGKTIEARQAAEKLGVRYLLQGSVQRAGDRVRINAQLIDATTGGHLWAERYDRKLGDIFALQDAISAQVVKSLELRLTKGDIDRQRETPNTPSMEAYDLVLRARRLLTRFDYEAATEARKQLERALALDPHYAEALSLLGLYHFDAWRLWGENRGENLARALELSRSATEANRLDPAPHVLAAQVHQFRREFDAALAAADAALALDPHEAITLANLGSMLRYAHRAATAARLVERAIRLDPFHPPNYLEWLADAYFVLGRYDDCARAVERGIALDPDFVALRVVSAKCYAGQDDLEKARDAARHVIRANPRFTIKAFASYVPYTDAGDLAASVEALRKSGLPE